MLTLLVNGEPATADDLLHLALVNYGCFTSMQAEQGTDGAWGVRGLDLHLARLRDGGLELFGRAPEDGAVRDGMRRAVQGQAGACSIRVNLFSRAFSVREPTGRVEPDVLVVAGPPAAEVRGPLKLAVARHAREAPHIKHVATFGMIRERRAAMEGGHDDVLFCDEAGWVTEGSIWNIGFLEGDTVVWPEGPMLAGTGQALVQRGLEAVEVATERRRIGLADLSGFDAAFVVNSAMAGVAVAAVGAARYAERPDLAALVKNAWGSNPCQPL